jgi:hypothetical protein
MYIYVSGGGAKTVRVMIMVVEVIMVGFITYQYPPYPHQWISREGEGA